MTYGNSKPCCMSIIFCIDYIPLLSYHIRPVAMLYCPCNRRRIRADIGQSHDKIIVSLTLKHKSTSQKITIPVGAADLLPTATAELESNWMGEQTMNLEIWRPMTLTLNNMNPKYIRLIEHGFTSAPTQYRLYGRRFLQV